MKKCCPFYGVSLLSAFVWVICINPSVAQEQNDLDVLKNYWLIHGDAPNSMYKHLANQAFSLLEKRTEKISRLKNADDWLARQAEIKQVLWEILGPFPEKTPLNAKITGKFKKEGYKVENIIYESLPGYYVTASLFLPDKLKKPAPAILFCSGHSAGAYRLESYQLPLLNLVKKGFVVLAIDPVGQGERLQYFDPEKGESVIGRATQEHSYAAVQVFLNAGSVARYFIWDGIRGIDYLTGRKEVDPERIGVHGLSGGGTQTAYISALDERVTASAPACYITSYRRLLESIGVQDGEQNLYRGLSKGIDHADYIIARAPRPTLIMATTRDFFSIQGTRETFHELKDVYTMLGKPENIEITEDDHGHGYTRKNREAMYGFFCKHLSLQASSTEEEVDFCTPEELQKTTTGQLSTSMGGETLFSLNLRESENILSRLRETRELSPVSSGDMLNSIRKISGFVAPSDIQEPVFTGRFRREDYVVEKYFVKGEGDYVIPFLLMIPDVPVNKAVIYLHPSGKAAEAYEGGEIEWFVKNGVTVLAPDLIGTGEMGPGDFKGDAVIGGVSYNTWFTSTITGRSIVGIRAGDVMRLRMLLTKRNEFTEILGVARKELAPVMLYASAFDRQINRIALIEPYSSYRSFVTSRFYYPGFVQNLVPGALMLYDLPDLAATLAPRPMIISGASGASGNYEDPDGIAEDIAVIAKAYNSLEAGDRIKIVSGDMSDKFFDLMMEWIK